MKARHEIYLHKLVGSPKPWTDNTILQEYKFCNVYRELDSTTAWIRQNIRGRWEYHRYLWFALAVARRINLPVTLHQLDYLLVDWDAKAVLGILEQRKLLELPIYSGAYSLSTSSLKMSKNHYTVYECLNKLWERRETISMALDKEQWTLEQVFILFAHHNPGISGFLSYEIITDMRHTRYLRNAPDIMTWAHAGPGAIRGLNRLYERPVDTKIKPCRSNKDMQYLLSVLEGMFLAAFPKLEMRDIEHSLCEFDKYLRIQNDKSFLCRKYNGKG